MSLIVNDPGLSATIQDHGRLGYRECGVGPGGPFDRGSADLANALLGNSAECAVLELTLAGGVYEAAGPLALAMAGAPMEAKVVAPDRIEQSVPIPSSWSLREGERLILGRAREGARTYLAVNGGWQTPIILGSRSSEARIRSGDILPAGFASTLRRRPIESGWQPPTAEPFRLIDGPDGGSRLGFDEAFWAARRFRVGARSDRMGLRLEGVPVAVAPTPDRLSAPVAPGAIQVAGGQLIVLGIACGTVGGYPHIAHVISADLDRLGQLKPGDSIAFGLVTLETARRLDREVRQARRLYLGRISTLAQDA